MSDKVHRSDKSLSVYPQMSDKIHRSNMTEH